MSWGRARFLSYLRELESTEVQQFAEYGTICSLCNDFQYGILDESRMTLPLGNFVRVLENRYSAEFDVTQRRVTVSRDSAYALRQEIVKSGLYTRAQLSAGHFTQHELEVAEASFYNLRPKRCSCAFGSPTSKDLAGAFGGEGSPRSSLDEYERMLIAQFADEDSSAAPDVQVEHPLDLDLIQGKRIRTGFRKRSPIARRRRRLKYRNKKFVPPNYTVGGLLALRDKSPKLIRDLPGKKLIPDCVRKVKIPKPRPGKLMKAVFNEGYHKVYPGTLPGQNEKKYWYFLRKRGRYYLSVHHPYPDG